MAKHPTKSREAKSANTIKAAVRTRNTKESADRGRHGIREDGRVAAGGVQHAKPTSTREKSFLASKVTARSQTTLPSGVRKALRLQAGDRISYVIENDQVVIRKVSDEDEDPALAGFLDLLGDDIAHNKDRVVFATQGFANYLEELTAGIEVDYDAPIEGDFQL